MRMETEKERGKKENRRCSSPFSLKSAHLGVASKFMFDWMCTLWAMESIPLKGSAICQSKFLKSCCCTASVSICVFV